MCIVFKENIISLFENFTCYYKVLLPVLDFAMDIVDRKKNLIIKKKMVKHQSSMKLEFKDFSLIVEQ